MPWFRVIQHLLPHSTAWSVTAEKKLRNFALALAEAPATFKTFVDEVWEEVFPEYTTHLSEWEREGGIFVNAADSDATRREKIDAWWKADGGQSPTDIEDVLHDSGFTELFVHECWSTVGPPTWVARDPGDYTEIPAIGTVQCSACDWGSYEQPQCSSGFDTSGGVDDGDPITQWQCDDLVANDPGYLVNSNLTRRAPPAPPDDSTKWPYFIYVSGEVLSTDVNDWPIIINTRRAEIERLLLKHCPTQHWIVLAVRWIAPVDIFSDDFDDSFE